jgi:hypothetical protein
VADSAKKCKLAIFRPKPSQFWIFSKNPGAEYLKLEPLLQRDYFATSLGDFPSIPDAALPSIAKKARLQSSSAEVQHDSAGGFGGGDISSQIPDSDTSFAEDQHDSAGGFAGGDIACPDPDTSAAGFNLSSVSSLQQQQGVLLPSSSSQQYSQGFMNPFLDIAAARRAFTNPFLDIAAARRALPSLHDQPDDYLRSQSYGDLVRDNATLANADQNSALPALDRRRMAVNFRELKAKPIRIEASWDDIDSLSQQHPARFLQGPPCTLRKLWQTARVNYS